MRKTVKLAAASALAAMALAAGSATAASAHDKHDQKDEPGWNFCGNGDGSLVSADDNGEVYTDDVEVTGVNDQTICQVGEDNEAVNVHRGDVAGDDLSIESLLEVLAEVGPPGPGA
jgi:ABC-type glycerol-3-phosphate transport system substrate-binding protein